VMDLGPWQDDILDRLEQGMNARVFAEGIPMNSPAPIDPTGLIKPFIVLWFGSLLTRNLLTEDLCGSQNSVREAVFIVQSFAGNGRALLAVENQARILLAGHRPAGQGQLFEAGSASVRDPSSVGLGIDIRFSKQSMWHGMVNAGMSMTEPVMTAVMGKGSAQKQKPCCPKGHAYAGQNLIEEPFIRRDKTEGVRRRCRECVMARRGASA
jgi:hypothetical protein